MFASGPLQMRIHEVCVAQHRSPREMRPTRRKLLGGGRHCSTLGSSPHGPRLAWIHNSRSNKR